MLNVRTSILGGTPSPASGGSVQPELLSLPSNVQAISALALGLLLVLGAVAALVAVRRRRRATAHYAALLAGSTPIGLAPAGGELSDASTSPVASAGASGALAADGFAGSRRSSPAAPTARVGEVPRSTRTSLGDEVPRSTRTALGDGGPRSSREGPPSERSSPRSAAPPSGINVPPASERQWQSQPPPRIGKEPPS
jgi:hypothetical protein